MEQKVFDTFALVSDLEKTSSPVSVYNKKNRTYIFKKLVYKIVNILTIEL